MLVQVEVRLPDVLLGGRRAIAVCATAETVPALLTYHQTIRYCGHVIKVLSAAPERS